MVHSHLNMKQADVYATLSNAMSSPCLFAQSEFLNYVNSL